MSRLTIKQIQNARNKGKTLKLADGHGLYLHVTETAKTWRYRYRILKKQREYTIGPYPLISLAEARLLHAEARRLVIEGICPVQDRREKIQEKNLREAEIREQSITFGQALDEWLRRQSPGWAPATRMKMNPDSGRLIDR